MSQHEAVFGVGGRGPSSGCTQKLMMRLAVATAAAAAAASMYCYRKSQRQWKNVSYGEEGAVTRCESILTTVHGHWGATAPFCDSFSVYLAAAAPSVTPARSPCIRDPAVALRVQHSATAARSAARSKRR